MMRIASVLLISLLCSLSPSVASAQSDFGIDSSYANNGMNVTWLEIDGIVHGLQISSFHLLPDGGMIAVGNAKWGCSNSWTIKGIVVKIDNNGFLDSTFYDNGQHKLETPSLNRVLLGADSSFFLFSRDHIIKIHSDGSLVDDFGDGGYLTPGFNLGSAALDHDGNILVIGSIPATGPEGPYNNSLLARFSQDGIQDLDFGTNGMAHPVNSANGQSFNILAIDSEGRIVLAGREFIASDNFHMLAARTMPDGSPDTSFGNNGVFVETLTQRSRPGTLLVTPDDAIVMAGQGRMSTWDPWNLLMIKFHSNGTLDTDFGNEGLQMKQIIAESFPNSLMRMPNGSLLLTGNALSKSLFTAKFHADGQSDADFGDDGVVITEVFEWSGSSGHSVLSENKIISVANSFYSHCAQSKWKAVFMRYNVGDAGEAVVAHTPEDISVCSNHPDSSAAAVNLEYNLSQIQGEQAGVNVSFYLSEEDANSQANAIEDPQAFIVDSPSQIIFARVTSDSNQNQFAVTSFAVLLSIPSHINAPPALVSCADDSEGYTTFNLDAVADEILQDVSEAELGFYSSEQGAQTGDANQLIDTQYSNQSPHADTVYIRMVEPSGCVSVTELPLVINSLPPDAAAISDDAQCTSSNGFGENFDLNARTTEILAGQDTSLFQVLFFLSQQDAIDNLNAVANADSFLATSDAQTIYIGILNTLTGCYSGGDQSFQLLLNAEPEVAQTPPTITMVAAAPDVATFDLTLNNDLMLGTQATEDVHFSFFETDEDAIAGINAIESPEAYTNLSNPQTIYVVMSSSADAQCTSSASFEIVVDNSLSADFPAFNNSLNLYPNPARDLAWLESGDQKITGVSIRDLNGKQLYASLADMSETKVLLDTSHLPAGVYVVEVRSGREVGTVKLVKL